MLFEYDRLYSFLWLEMGFNAYCCQSTLYIESVNDVTVADLRGANEATTPNNVRNMAHI